MEYFRELRLLDPYTMDLRLAGLSKDASHFILRNECFRADGKMAARITSEGGWLHLDRRGLRAPPVIRPQKAALLSGMTTDMKDWRGRPTK